MSNLLKIIDLINEEINSLTDVEQYDGECILGLTEKVYLKELEDMKKRVLNIVTNNNREVIQV